MAACGSTEQAPGNEHRIRRAGRRSTDQLTARGSAGHRAADVHFPGHTPVRRPDQRPGHAADPRPAPAPAAPVPPGGLVTEADMAQAAAAVAAMSVTDQAGSVIMASSADAVGTDRSPDCTSAASS